TTTMSIRAYAASESKAEFKEFDYDPGTLGDDEVEIAVEYCGVCHSDLSMWQNDWGMSDYPFVGGHEVAGKVVEKGGAVSHLEIGQKVGLGWHARSCGTCDQCLGGNHNLCRSGVGTITGRHGGFAERVRAQSLWVTPLPDALSMEKVGPLFCGGITVFNPIVQNHVSPMDRVAVVGIGGLGHMALQFLNRWGCEVTAISTSPDKEEAAREFGAHAFINARADGELEKAEDSFDFILVTANANLPWDKYVAALRPKGKLHLVGAAAEVKATVFPLIGGEKSIGASPVGSPGTIARMLEFSARHEIAPKTEVMPMSEVNEALKRLHEDSPSHRLVLKNDFD
ncbi:MAG: putative zinc-type alcohol dehydrogenase-like protein, partial [Verrucomicrobiales bacterium]